MNTSLVIFEIAFPYESMKIILPIITSFSIVALKGNLSLNLHLQVFQYPDSFFPDNRSAAALAKISSSSEPSLTVDLYYLIRFRVEYQIENSVVGSDKKMLLCLYYQIILLL